MKFGAGLLENVSFEVYIGGKDMQSGLEGCRIFSFFILLEKIV